MRTLTRLGILALITVVFSASALAQYSQPVRDVENPARTPFWGNGNGTIDTSYVNVQILVGTVPAGQRLVIEHVAVNCKADADDNFPLVTINVYKKVGVGWSSYSVPLVVEKQGTTYDSKGSWTVSQALRLYSDGIAGYGTYVNVNRSKTASASASCFAIVSGYTLSTP